MNQVMYIGPDIERVVMRNQVFTYYPKAQIEKVKELDPLAEKLFVPMDEIVEKKRELGRRGSLLNTAYRRLAQLRRE